MVVGIDQLDPLRVQLAVMPQDTAVEEKAFTKSFDTFHVILGEGRLVGWFVVRIVSKLFWVVPDACLPTKPIAWKYQAGLLTYLVKPKSSRIRKHSL